MPSKNIAVFGIYQTRNHAEHTVDRLLETGFSNDDISVLIPDYDRSKQLVTDAKTKVPGRTVGGATGGGAIGGTFGLLAGIGVMAIPGFGLMIAAGPMMPSLAAIGVGGAVGGLIGALIGAGFPEFEAKRFEGRIKAGGILLSVHCDKSDEVLRAKTLLRRMGAQNISSSGEAAEKYALAASAAF
jgi:hypothetical protein